MWTIQIKNAMFFANHGVYLQETKLGNEFVVNVTVGFEAETISIMEQTIDYVTIYHIVETQMKATKKLLEEVVSCISTQIKESFPQIKSLDISIQKKHPAFGKEIEATVVGYSM
jgi:7,8-dihydroneopterin aldolase/epimerase/oxygenase